jgi:hypothetical protein
VPIRRLPRSKSSASPARSRLGTFDLSPTILQAVADGKMEWGIDAQQYLMGYIPVVAFDLLKKYKLAPIADYPTGPGFVTKDGSSLGHRARQAGRSARLARRRGRLLHRVGPGDFCCIIPCLTPFRA